MRPGVARRRLTACLSCLSQNFGAPSFDDRKLEVVAVFGSMQMAVSRVISLQHHRIAQVRAARCPSGPLARGHARANPGLSDGANTHITSVY